MIENNSVDNPSTLKILQTTVFASVILYFGRELFIPLSLALLISFILYPICRWFEKKGVKRLLSIIISITFLFIFGLLIGFLLVKQIASFAKEWPELHTKLIVQLGKVSEAIVNGLGITKENQNRWVERIVDGSGDSVLDFLRSAISISVFSAVMMILIPVYSVLILYYRHHWINILYHIFPSESEADLKDVIYKTIQAYFNFIKGMGIVYLVVGILNSIGLLLLGIPHAILFGFTTSVLTFIPYVGIVAGSLLPLTIAWLNYDSIWYPIGIIGVFTFVQYLEANVIFPWAVSYRLKVNTLVMLLAILAGGLLWGVSGMILFVPFVGIAKIIADHQKWKVISMLLGSPD